MNKKLLRTAELLGFKFKAFHHTKLDYHFYGMITRRGKASEMTAGRGGNLYESFGERRAGLV